MSDEIEIFICTDGLWVYLNKDIGIFFSTTFGPFEPANSYEYISGCNLRCGTSEALQFIESSGINFQQFLDGAVQYAGRKGA